MARVFVSKKDYELVNDEEMKKAAVMGRNSPLKVVMCKEGQLYENQVAYYKIARDAALDSYKKRVAILQKEGKEKELLLAKMQIEFNQQITSTEQANELLHNKLQKIEEEAKALADKFITVNLDDQTESYQRAFQAFMDKDIDQALMILDSVNLAERLKINTEEKDKDEAIIAEKQESVAQKEKQIQQDINQCVFKAELHILKYEFKKAEYLFELALKYDVTNEKLIFQFAYFLQKQNNFDKAIQRYEEALEIYRALSEKNPDAYNFPVCGTLINMGLLYEELLEGKGDMSLKGKGISLMEECQKRLDTYDNTHPKVAQYQVYITRLSAFFEDFSEADYLWQQKINSIDSLKEQNRVEKDFHQRVISQEEIIQKLLVLGEDTADDSKLLEKTAKEYGNLAWYQLFDKQFEAAEVSARKGMGMSEGAEWINTNFALALLFQGKFEDAKAVYLNLKDKSYGDGIYAATFLADFDALEKEGITHPDVEKIRDLLR